MSRQQTLFGIWRLSILTWGWLSVSAFFFFAGPCIPVHPGRYYVESEDITSVMSDDVESGEHLHFQVELCLVHLFFLYNHLAGPS